MDRNGIKSAARARLTPLVSALDQMGVTPDMVTVVGLAVSLLAAWIVAGGQLFLGALVLAIGSSFDMLDGELARLQGRASRRGAFLDSNFDRLAEGALYAGLAWFYLESVTPSDSSAVLMIVLALTGSLTTSYARARAEALGAECSGGWLQRPERMVLLVVGMLLGRHVLKLVLALLAIATLLTTLQRILSVSRELGDAPLPSQPPRPSQPSPAPGPPRDDAPTAADAPGGEGPDPDAEVRVDDQPFDDDDPYGEPFRHG